MRFLVASDLHGDSYWTERVIKAFNDEKADKLVLLGDILYHGPRNDLPSHYEPKKVISLLNSMASSILAVRGNCDTEVDQMVLDFPVLADYCWIYADGCKLFLTHGHRFNPDELPPLSKGDFLLNGHTHVPMIKDFGDYTYINCGSVSIPKANSSHSYIIFEGGKFELMTLL